MSKQGWKHCCLPGHWSPKLIKKVGNMATFRSSYKGPMEVDRRRSSIYPFRKKWPWRPFCRLSYHRWCAVRRDNTVANLLRIVQIQDLRHVWPFTKWTFILLLHVIHEIDMEILQKYFRSESRKPSLRNQNQLMNFAKNHKEGIAAAAMCIK